MVFQCQLEVERVVEGQSARSRQREGDRKIGGRVGTDRNGHQASKPHIDLNGGKPAPPLGGKKGVPHLQMPEMGYDGPILAQSRQRGTRSLIKFIVKEPIYRYRGVDNQEADQRWPSCRVARISCLDIPVGCQPARRCKN